MKTTKDNDMKLSDNERMVMNRFNSDNRYSFFDGGYVAEDSGTYLSEFIPEMASAMGKPESSARTVFSSMKKKGLFTTSEVAAEDPITAEDGTIVQEGKPADQWVELTEAGVELIADLRIEEDEAVFDLDEEDDDDDEDEGIETVITAAAKKRQAETDGRKAAAKESIKQGKPSLRTSHADCDHATQGAEGKIARAKCRRERAAKAKADQEKAEKKAAKKASANA